MKTDNPPTPPLSLRPKAVSDPEGKGGTGGFETYFLSEAPRPGRAFCSIFVNRQAHCSLLLGYLETWVFIVNDKKEPFPPYILLGHQHPQSAGGQSLVSRSLQGIEIKIIGPAANSCKNLAPVARYGAGRTDHLAKGAAHPHVALCFARPEHPWRSRQVDVIHKAVVHTEAAFGIGTLLRVVGEAAVGVVAGPIELCKNQ